MNLLQGRTGSVHGWLFVRERMQGPGWYYNLGNAFGLATGIFLDFLRSLVLLSRVPALIAVALELVSLDFTGAVLTDVLAPLSILIVASFGCEQAYCFTGARTNGEKASGLLMRSLAS